MTNGSSGPLATALASAGTDARAYSCDVTEADSVARTFDAIQNDLGPAHTLVYNAGSGIWGNIEVLRSGGAALQGDLVATRFSHAATSSSIESMTA